MISGEAACEVPPKGRPPTINLLALFELTSILAMTHARRRKIIIPTTMMISTRWERYPEVSSFNRDGLGGITGGFVSVTSDVSFGEAPSSSDNAAYVEPFGDREPVPPDNGD